jgi:hypothetical protein
VTWRKESAEKERTNSRGNPSQESRYEHGMRGAVGDSFLLGNQGGAAINSGSDATSPQLDEFRNVLAGKKENGPRILNDMGAGKAHVVQESVISVDGYHAHMQEDATKDHPQKVATFLHIEESGGG